MFNFKIKKKRYMLPLLDVHILDHCNLKCNHCAHYCHLIKEENFLSVEQLEQDMCELSKKIFFRIIRLMGGEPLLHPKLSDMLKLTRKYYPYTDIRIVTNGILLPAMDETFWDTMRKYHITVDISKYPILGNKFSELLDLIDDNRVRLGHVNLCKRFYDKVNDEGSVDKEKAYAVCASRMNLNLWNSKIYTCQACYRDYYNKIYNKNVLLPKGYDIYKTTGKELYNAFGKPDEACRHCDIISREFAWSKYDENAMGGGS